MFVVIKSKLFFFGQYVLKCDVDGYFEKVQCYEGYCFCVDNRGILDFFIMLRFMFKCLGK